jgi:uncharacterized protein (TIGR02145 family)
MAVITPIRINVDFRSRGQYLRWYYNGWHHYYFASADENFNTSGEKYRTKLTYKLSLGDEVLTKRQLTAISGLVKGKVAQMLTSDGWKAITIDDQSIDYGRNDLTGAAVELSISVWAKVGVYTPMLPVTITPPEPEPVYTAIKYGSLYNWFAATDVRGIANGDFDVPTDAEFETLASLVLYDGEVMRENNISYWVSELLGTNTYNFNARGSGRRLPLIGFEYLKNEFYAWCNNGATPNYYFITSSFEGDYTADLTYGFSIRLVRAATEAEQLQTDGSACTPYTGNDGKVYRTVKIGTQVWTADNLAETLFATGYTDWYLPSRDELKAMYDELHAYGVASFKDIIYWTSTEVIPTHAGYISFIDGIATSGQAKTSNSSVRPIRDFTSTNIYALRDFVQGGLIFHITDLGGGSYKYYVAAPEDSIALLQWGASGVTTGATGTAIGTGKANTALIIAALEAIPETGKAAQYCDEYDSQVIPTVTDDAEWVALTTGARCAYDNNEENVLI